MSTTTRFKTCFVSAPQTVDLYPIWEILRQKGLERVDYHLETSFGSEPSLKIENAISRADFLFAILHSEDNNKNIYFEMGLAFAKNKPIFLLTETSNDIPSTLKSIFYVQSKATDFEAIKYNLDIFLEHHRARIKKIRTTSKRTEKEQLEGPAEVFFDEASKIHDERELVSLLSKAFIQAGFLTETESRNENRFVDIAVWINQIETPIGNPVIVEVKAGRLTSNRIHEGVAQLFSFLINSSGRLGLLVYKDSQGIKYSHKSKGWPIIIVLEIGELLHLLATGDFVNYLLSERNRIIHGEG